MKHLILLVAVLPSLALASGRPGTSADHASSVELLGPRGAASRRADLPRGATLQQLSRLTAQGAAKLDGTTLTVAPVDSVRAAHELARTTGKKADPLTVGIAFSVTHGRTVGSAGDLGEREFHSIKVTPAAALKTASVHTVMGVTTGVYHVVPGEGGAKVETVDTKGKRSTFLVQTKP